MPAHHLLMNKQNPKSKKSFQPGFKAIGNILPYIIPSLFLSLTTSFYGNSACAQTSSSAIDALMNEGKAYVNQGKNNLAQTAYKKALDLAKKHSPSQVNQLNQNLAQVYANNGNYSLAEETAQKALDAAKTSAQSNDLASSYSALGLIQSEKGEYAAAESNFEQAINIAAQQSQPNKELAVYLDNLATVYQKTKRYEDAAKLQEKSISIYDALNMKDSDDYMVTLSNLATSYEHMGKLDLAESMHKVSMEAIKTKFGAESNNYATALDNYALLCLHQGRTKEADQLQAQALEIYSKNKGSNQSDMAVLLTNMAASKWRQNDLVSALKYAKQSFDLNKKLFGVQSPRFLASQTAVTKLSELIAKAGIK